MCLGPVLVSIIPIDVVNWANRLTCLQPEIAILGIIVGQVNFVKLLNRQQTTGCFGTGNSGFSFNATVSEQSEMGS